MKYKCPEIMITEYQKTNYQKCINLQKPTKTDKTEEIESRIKKAEQKNNK